jgi:hypothetical protein
MQRGVRLSIVGALRAIVSHAAARSLDRRIMAVPMEMSATIARMRNSIMCTMLGLALLTLTVASACGDGDPIDVSLARISANASDYHGKLVRLEGTVVGFENPEHYVIEDGQQNRVQLLPNELARPFVGEQATVVGRFTFSDTQGRRLAVTWMESARSSSSPDLPRIEPPASP